MLRLGLFIYDHMGGRKLLPPTRTLDMRTDPAGKPRLSVEDAGPVIPGAWNHLRDAHDTRLRNIA